MRFYTFIMLSPNTPQITHFIVLISGHNLPFLH